MADIPEAVLVHEAAVLTLEGSNSYGDVFESSTTFPCFISHRRKLIQAGDGAQTRVSEATLRTSLDLEDAITPGSEIVLHVERDHQEATTVLSVEANTDGGLGAWQHLRVTVGSARSRAFRVA